jgi:hypothetical protein
MRSTVLIALLFIAVSSINTKAIGQNVYKCGSVYSQSPCPGGVAIDANDSRTPAEKAQRDALTAQTSRSAEQMEKERLVQEQQNLVANSPRPAPVVKAKPHAPVVHDPVNTLPLAKKPKLKRPKKTPEGFIAIVPGTHKPKTKKKAEKAAE